MLDFKEISIKDKQIIDNYYKQFGEGSCQHSFAVNFCLQNKYHDIYAEKNGVLFILRSGLNNDHERYYLFPMCDRNDKLKVKLAIDEVVSDAHYYNKKVKFYTITRKCKELIEETNKELFYFEDRRDLYEYIYDVKKIACMNGSLFQSKRNIINKLCKTYKNEIITKEICQSDIDKIKNVYLSWIENHTDEEKNIFENEIKEFNLAIDNFDKINLCGIAVYVGSKLIGFNFGTIISNNTYDGMIQKGNYEYNGIYELLNRETAIMLKDKVLYMNFEEDLGVPGLRKAKLMYHPDILLEKYIATEV